MAYRYIEAPVLLFLACIIYLVIRKHLFPLNLLPRLRAKSSAYLIANLLFFALYAYSILLVILRAEPYSRPLGYFIAVAVMAALIAAEIFFFQEKWNSALILSKIMLVALSLRWVPQLLFPGVIGVDTFTHEGITEKIVNLGYIPEGFGYTKMPAMHLIISFISLVTGLDYKFSTMFSICFLQAVSLIFIFLLGRFIYNSKVGLLGALLLGVAGIQIEHGMMVRPITLAVLLMPIILYLVFRARKGQSLTFTTLALLMGWVLILTHTIGAMGMAILLFLLWLGSALYKGIYAKEPIMAVSLSLAILFTVAMVSWWLYVSGHFYNIPRLIMVGFTDPKAGWVATGVGESP